MGKASNQGDGVIACTWAFPPACRRPVHLWSGSRKVPVAWWMPVMEKWLVEASFLLRLLMAPSSHPKRIREASPEFRTAPAQGGCHHLHLSPAGAFPAPDAFASLTPWPGSKLTREEYIPRGWASGTSVQESSWPNLLVDACLKGGLSNVPQVPRSGLPQRWLRGCPEPGPCGACRPSALESCGQVRGQSRDTPVRTRVNPRPFWEKVAWQEAGTSREGIISLSGVEHSHMARRWATGRATDHRARKATCYLLLSCPTRRGGSKQ